VSRVKELLAGNGEQEQVEIFKASPVGTQWLVASNLSYGTLDSARATSVS
jgi:hypothetical protein